MSQLNVNRNVGKYEECRFVKVSFSRTGEDQGIPTYLIGKP